MYYYKISMCYSEQYICSTFCIIMNGVSNFFFFFIKKRIQQPQTDLDKKTTSRQIVETRRRPDFVVCKIFISNLKYWSENVVLVNCFCFTMNLRLEVILRINISWIIQGLILFTYLALTRHKYWFWFLPWWRSAMREISDCIVSNA